MSRIRRCLMGLFLSLFVLLPSALLSHQPEDDGFIDLFNGRDFEGWIAPPKGEDGWHGPWTIENGYIHGDVRHATGGDQSLWTTRKFKDFVLEVEWRIWETPFENSVPVIQPNGEQKKDIQGKPMVERVAEADSGIYLRGSSKSQVNIWCWPVGSGEVYGYRTDGRMSAAVRAGVTPKKKADHSIGEWNRFVITMVGDRLTVELNGEKVIDHAELPGIPKEGNLALQHHGGYNSKTGRFTGPPSQVDFRKVRIKELPSK